MEYLAYSNKGLSYSRNEDAFVIDKTIFQEDKAEGDVLCFCGIADGIGGLSNGDQVSRSLCQFLAENFSPSIGFSKELLEAANHLILDRYSNPKGGSTFVGVSFQNNVLFGMNVGDSRCYYFVDEIYDQLSLDDKFAASGDGNNNSHVITKYFGNVRFDYGDVHFFSQEIKPGSVVLLCSDGVTDYIDVSLVNEILMENRSLRESSEVMNQEILRNGAKDNFTYILIRN